MRLENIMSWVCMACSFALSLFISQSWEMTDASTMHQKNKQNYMIIRGIVDEKDISYFIHYTVYPIPDWTGPMVRGLLPWRYWMVRAGW